MVSGKWIADERPGVSARSERPAISQVNARWPHLANAIVALWLLSSPATLGYESRALAASDLASGAALFGLSVLAFRHAWAAWLAAGVGLWVMTAPLLFWAPTAAAYNNGSLLGALIVAFAIVVPRLNLDEPEALPPGWTYNPSGWTQRLPIVAFALIGFFLSRYMAAFQLGHIDRAWDPFFGDGTERVLESDVSKAFPVSDAGLGAWSYLLDALAGLLGGRRRWRTMPWMVLLFGIFVIPPGVTSIVLVMLQPIGVGAWCTLCLIAAVVMLIMAPPAIDEVIASVQFLRRTRREGGSVWRALWTGEGSPREDRPDPARRRRPWKEIVDAVEIFSMPWNLALSAAIGVWLMAAPGVLGIAPPAANHDYVVGALVVTIAVVAAAEPARALRWLNIACGLWLILAVWLAPGFAGAAMWSNVVAGAALVALSVRRGRIAQRFATWDRLIV